MKAPAVPIFQYPDKLKDEQFKNRKFSIYVKDPTVQARAASMVSTIKKNASVAGVKSIAASAVNSTVSAFNQANTSLNNSLNGVQEVAHVSATNAAELAQIKRNNANANSDPVIAAIVLPVPNSLSDSQSHDYDTTTGLAAEALKYGAKKVFGDGYADIASHIANQAGTHQTVTNPKYFQNYTGTKPRTFQSSWDLIPESRAEADMIFQIVMKLKEFSSPSLSTGGATLVSPMYFSVELNNDYLTSMLSLDKVVITQVSLNYSSDDSMQLTRDGMPKQMRLDISFSEVTVQTSEDYSTEPTRG